MTPEQLAGVALQIMQYAEGQIEFARKAASAYLTNIRLSRAKGALESIKSFTEHNPKWQQLTRRIDSEWATLSSIYDQDDDDAPFDEYEFH